MRIEKCPFCAAYLHFDENNSDVLLCWNCHSRMTLPMQTLSREGSQWLDEHLPDSNGVARLLIIGVLGLILFALRRF